jgi:hypothetical protein
VVLTAYKPKYFTSAAILTATLEIIWHETGHKRTTVLTRALKERTLDMHLQTT